MHKYHFNKSDASSYLVDELAKLGNDTITRKVVRLMSSYNCKLKALTNQKNYYGNLHFEYTKHIVEKYEFPKLIETLVINNMKINTLKNNKK